MPESNRVLDLQRHVKDVARRAAQARAWSQKSLETARERAHVKGEHVECSFLVQEIRDQHWANRNRNVPLVVLALDDLGVNGAAVASFGDIFAFLALAVDEPASELAGVKEGESTFRCFL